MPLQYNRLDSSLKSIATIYLVAITFPTPGDDRRGTARHPTRQISRADDHNNERCLCVASNVVLRSYYYQNLYVHTYRLWSTQKKESALMST